MSERRHPNVVNVDEIEARKQEKGRRFASAGRGLGRASGGKGLGCTHYEVAPGKTAYPHHFHSVLDEAIYILEGEGTLRLGAAKVAVRPGDYISMPPGPQAAHQLLNSGAGPLRYLCVSTMASAEIVGYPDSKKVAARSRDPESSDGKPWVQVIARESDSLDYYDGEETD